jgi:hypothetical protein
MAPEITPPVKELLDGYLKETGAGMLRDSWGIFNFDVSNLAAYQAILDLPRKQQVLVLLEAIPRQVELINHPDTCGCDKLRALISKLLRYKLPFTDDQLERLVRAMSGIERQGWWTAVSPGNILRAVEDGATAKGMSPGLHNALEGLAAKLRGHTYYVEPRDLLKQVEALLARVAPAEAGAEGAPTVLQVRGSRGVELTTDEVWTHALRAALAGMDTPTREAWDALLTHCALAASSKPSGKWLTQAETLIATIGAPPYAALVGATLAEVGKPGGSRVGERDNALGFAPDPTQVHDTHSDLLRGLVWCTSLVDNAELTARVGTTADVCFKKLSGIGPRAPKIGNACVWALGHKSTTAAVGELSRLKTRAKHASIQSQLGKALDIAAEKTGMSAEDLEEVAVPTCGLTGVGEYRRQLGDCVVMLQTSAKLKTETSWLRPDGKEQRSVPAPVKEEFAAEVKALKQMEKEVEKLLPAQRDRLEQLFLQERSWSWDEFRNRFLDHPLVGVVARRLIWRFTDGPHIGDGIWRDGRIVDEQGRSLAWLGAGSRVTLWHPLNGGIEQIRAWREWLEAHEVCQPFKQAHREIYLLTDAERDTGIYSNRFGAHILKQHQFGALCHQKGWRYALQGDWDSANTPTVRLPRWDLRAEFLVKPVQERPLEERAALRERTDLVNMMTFRYLATDQVRFYRLDSPVPLPLTEVPPLVFSEIMRTVDLFVGVAGIGNDPTWTDSGLFGHYRHYWERYSNGELFPSAQTRRAVLERIVPRLKIAERCSFSEKHLIVRGDLRTYKIHLGSGNILMSPNDQYLCIIPNAAAGAAAGKIYLPFEGDGQLSIILSKALLLAEDKKIKDPTILKQMAPLPPVPGP